MRPLATLALALLLPACAGTDAVSRLQPSGFVQEAPELVADADWSAPETITVTLTNYAFSPADLEFHRGRPTRLVLVNATAKDHTFVSDGLFGAIAVSRIVGPDQTLEGPWAEKVAAPAGQTKELWFIPARYGAYRFECSVTGHALMGMTGLANVGP